MKEKVQVRYYDHSSRSKEPLTPCLLTEIGFYRSQGVTSDGHKFIVLSVGYDQDGDYDNPYIVIMLNDLISIQRLKVTGPEMKWGEFNK